MKTLLLIIAIWLLLNGLYVVLMHKEDKNAKDNRTE